MERDTAGIDRKDPELDDRILEPRHRTQESAAHGAADDDVRVVDRMGLGVSARNEAGQPGELPVHKDVRDPRARGQHAVRRCIQVIVDADGTAVERPRRRWDSIAFQTDPERNVARELAREATPTETSESLMSFAMQLAERPRGSSLSRPPASGCQRKARASVGPLWEKPTTSPLSLIALGSLSRVSGNTPRSVTVYVIGSEASCFSERFEPSPLPGE